MRTEPPRNHVIFLGAGASYTSGYPMGNSLRLRLSCRTRYQAEMHKALGMTPLEVGKVCDEHLKAFGGSMDLFRNGEFGTVDEFSKLMSDSQPERVEEMKHLMRFALFFHNPENKFEDSDYYPFVQRLFQDEDLRSFKKHISVISYNYDCYLDFLLWRAYKVRQGLDNEDREVVKNRLTSGFHNLHDTKWAEQTQGFNHFKLHGSIAQPGNVEFTWNRFFNTDPKERLSGLADEYNRTWTVPVIFPWDLFDDSGKFIKEDDFVLVRTSNRQQEAEGRALFKTYEKIWKGAKAVVQRAEKISFVGLSMHPYLNEGLEYLFSGKEGTIQTVVANPENTEFQQSKNRLHPASLCGRVSEMLSKVAPDMKYVRSSSEDDGTVNLKDFEEVKQGEWEPDITPRYSFEDFIRTEMA